MPIPTLGQKTIPIKDWKRFLRVADWFERVIEHGAGVLPTNYGQTLIVKTPAAGIPARNGTTIISKTCIKCVAAETATPGLKTIHETGEELSVSNLDTAAVSGDAFIKTALSPNGTRYAELSMGWEWGKLDNELFSGGGANMSIWRDDPLADTGENIVVTAPPQLTSGSMVGGSWVWAMQHSNGLWYVMGGEC